MRPFNRQKVTKDNSIISERINVRKSKINWTDFAENQFSVCDFSVFRKWRITRLTYVWFNLNLFKKNQCIIVYIILCICRWNSKSLSLCLIDLMIEILCLLPSLIRIAFNLCLYLFIISFRFILLSFYFSWSRFVLIFVCSLSSLSEVENPFNYNNFCQNLKFTYFSIKTRTDSFESVQNGLKKIKY